MTDGILAVPMGYHHIDPSAVDPPPDRPRVRRAIDDAHVFEDVSTSDSSDGVHPSDPEGGTS